MKIRNLAIMALLAVVTLGIYVLVWLYKTRKELLQHTRNPKAIPPFIFLLLPYILFLCLMVLGLIDGGENNPVINILLFIGAPVAIIGMLVIPLWWFYRYFTTLHNVTQATDGMLLYIIWLLCVFVAFFPVWMLLVQNDLNKAAARLAATPHDMPRPDQPVHPSQPAPPAAF